MPRPPSLNRVIILGWVAKTRIGTNQHGDEYFTFSLATSRFVDEGGVKKPSYDMHYITIFGPENVKHAAKNIKRKANVMIEGFLRYLDKREVLPDGTLGRIKQRYTYIQAEYWQVCKEGEEVEPTRHTSIFREGIDADALNRLDKDRDRFLKENEDAQGQDRH